MEQIKRIEYMESILHEAAQTMQQLLDALEKYRAIEPKLGELEAYYTGPQWMRDYEDDCAGKLPQTLSRGVLSEDAVYDLLSTKDELEKLLAPKE